MLVMCDGYSQIKALPKSFTNQWHHPMLIKSLQLWHITYMFLSSTMSIRPSTFMNGWVLDHLSFKLNYYKLQNSSKIHWRQWKLVLRNWNLLGPFPRIWMYIYIKLLRHFFCPFFLFLFLVSQDMTYLYLFITKTPPYKSDPRFPTNI